MILDRKPIVGANREQLNSMFSSAWNWSHEVLIGDLIDNWICGPDCYELVLGGQVYVVNDTDKLVMDKQLDCELTSCHYQHVDGVIYICDRPLFELCRRLSPYPTCEEITRQRYPIWFVDNNYPGVVYCGVQDDFDRLMNEHGGYPVIWRGAKKCGYPRKGFVDIKVREGDNEATVERWEVRDGKEIS